MNNTLSFASLSFNAQNTPVSNQFDDIYFSTQDGLAESEYVFQEGNQLWQKWLNHPKAHFVIAETGFGTGLNFLAVAHRFQLFLQQYPNASVKRLYFISFEKYPLTADQLRLIHQQYPQFNELSESLITQWQPQIVGCQRYHFPHCYLDLWFGDLNHNLTQLGDMMSNTIDCWFLDGFSPDKNPDMWNTRLYQEMFRLTKAGGSFATFTAASLVRKGLLTTGFEVYKRKGFGRKREMLWGEKPLSSPNTTLKLPYYYQPAPSKADDFAIVGGGIASFWLALSLLERGKKVTLYCQDNALAQNASGNQQGTLYPQLSDDDSRNIRFYLHSFLYALQRIEKLKNKFPFEAEFSGVALYSYNDKIAQKLNTIATQQWGKGLFELLNATELSEKIGLTVPNGGAFIDQGGWISPIQFVQNGFNYLTKLGLNIVLNHPVCNIEFQQGKWCWQYQGDTFSHNVVILANGHTLKAFPQSEGIPLYPVRGQVSQIPTTPRLNQLKTVLCFDGYITPVSNTHTHCLGASHIRDNASMEFSLIEQQQNFAKISKNLTACDWIKDIDVSQNQAKVGVRAAFRDRIPMCGAMPNFIAQKQQYRNLYNLLRRQQPITPAESYPNLYLLAGLASRGLTTAPLLGELLASQLCQEPLPLSEDIWHALSPNRSWIRKLLKGSSVA